MHLNCTMAKGLFAAEGFQVVNEKPLPFLWDCHHGDTFVLMVKGLLAEPVSGETAAEPVILELALTPGAEVHGAMEHFAAAPQPALDSPEAPAGNHGRTPDFGCLPSARGQSVYLLRKPHPPGPGHSPGKYPCSPSRAVLKAGRYPAGKPTSSSTWNAPGQPACCPMLIPWSGKNFNHPSYLRRKHESGDNRCGSHAGVGHGPGSGCGSEAFRAYGEGRVNMPPKAYLTLDRGGFPGHVRRDFPSRGTCLRAKMGERAPRQPAQGTPHGHGQGGAE